MYVPSFSDFYVIADSNDWGHYSNSDIGTGSQSSGSSSTGAGSESVEEEEKIQEVKKAIAPCEEIKRIELEIEDLVRRDPRFLAFKGMTHDDLEKLRYEIKKENPDLAKVAFSRKNILGHIWPYLLVGAFQNFSRKDYDVATDDRRQDDDFTLSINTLADLDGQINLGKHIKKRVKVSAERKSHEHRHEARSAESDKKDNKNMERLSVVEAGKLYLKKYGGPRPEKFGAEIADHGADMTYRRLEGVLWHHKLDNAKPVLALPSLIKKYHLLKKEANAKKLGPGTYDPHYFQEVQDAKRNKISKGAMSSSTKRFPYDTEGTLLDDMPPEPEFLNPYTALEKAEDRYRHPCKKTLFEGQHRCFRKTKAHGAPVGPGAYEVKSSIQELLDKKVSKRGPYDVFSEPRDRIMFGYNKTLKPNSDLGPGSYFNFHKETVGSRINNPCSKCKGKISKLLPEGVDYQTGERNLIAHPMWPRSTTSNLPGPGTYDYAMRNGLGTNVQKNKYAFNSTSVARPKEQWNEAMQIDPARYRMRQSHKLLYNITGNGMKSVFKSKAAARLPFKDFPKYTERLRGKDIPEEERREKYER